MTLCGCLCQSNKKGGDGRKSPCKHCGKFHKGPDDQCWTLDKNKHNRPDGYRTPRSDRDNKKRKYADNDKQHWKKKQEEAVSRAVKKATMRIKKHYKTKYAKKKTSSRRRHALSDSDSDSEVQDNCAARRRLVIQDSSSEEEEDESSTSASTISDDSSVNSSLTGNYSTDSESSYIQATYAFYERTRVTKRPRRANYTAEIIVEIEDRYGNLVPIRGLVDTGTLETIVLRQFVRKGRAKSYKGKPTTWNTMGGKFTTKQKALIDFKLPELDPG